MANLNLRLFFALWPADTVRKELMANTESWRPQLAAHWIKPANLHITLAFLGDVDAGRLGEAQAAADAVGAEGFELSLDTLEHWRKPKILCLTPTVTPAPLTQLARDLAARLTEAGFDLDQRPYRPHLTLARKAAYLPADASLTKPIPWKASEFVLVESRQDSRGSFYGILKTWPLRGSPGQAPTFSPLQGEGV